MMKMAEAAKTMQLRPVPMLDFQREFRSIRGEVLAAIEAVCESQRFIMGPEVARFEQSAAAACGVPFGIGCGSGTDALWLALAAARIGPRECGAPDAALTTPFSFFATVSSILRAGAVPLLADIDERTFNLCPAAAERAVATYSGRPGDGGGRRGPDGGRIAAIMPVHLFGQCADMTALSAIAAAHEMKVIEDAAQAFGAGWQLAPAAGGVAAAGAPGSSRGDGPVIHDGYVRAGALGDAAGFSFYPTKNLSAFGEAGMVTTRSPEIAERAAMLRVHGMRRRYVHDEVGWNSRLDTLQAAVLEVKLRHLNAGNARRRELAARYSSLFRAADLAAPPSSRDVADGIILPYTDSRAEHVFHQYVIRVADRDSLREHLAAQGIGSEVYYPLPLHLQPSLQFLGYRRGDFPVSERAAAEVLALPIFPELEDEELETVVEATRRFFA
jgi:dTDP-4-amino-4,6-dideoxygalactose transaminase